MSLCTYVVCMRVRLWAGNLGVCWGCGVICACVCDVYVVLCVCACACMWCVCVIRSQFTMHATLIVYLSSVTLFVDWYLTVHQLSPLYSLQYKVMEHVCTTWYSAIFLQKPSINKYTTLKLLDI